MDKKETKFKSVLLEPHVTEKAAILANKNNVYAFNVAPSATKRSVILSIKKDYNVTPVDVHLLSMPKKKVFRRGRVGSKGGGKKAYVYLKKGDKIEVM